MFPTAIATEDESAFQEVFPSKITKNGAYANDILMRKAKRKYVPIILQIAV